MLIFATVSLPLYSLASSSSEGAIMRQGLHHSAQKSTTTGVLESRTSAWKLWSVTLIGAMNSSWKVVVERNVGTRVLGVKALKKPVNLDFLRAPECVSATRP